MFSLTSFPASASFSDKTSKSQLSSDLALLHGSARFAYEIGTLVPSLPFLKPFIIYIYGLASDCNRRCMIYLVLFFSSTFLVLLPSVQLSDLSNI